MVKTKKSIIALLILMMLLVGGCDLWLKPGGSDTDSNGVDDARPEVYFTLQFLELGTNNVVHEISLDYNISNIDLFQKTSDFDLIVFSNLVYCQSKAILMEGDDIIPIVDWFTISALNREVTALEMGEDSAPPSITWVNAFISNFGGKTDTYNFCSFDEEGSDNSVMFSFLSNQIAKDFEYSTANLESSGENTLGYVKLDEYGDVGEYIRGEIVLNNISLQYFEKYGYEHSEIPIAEEQYDLFGEFCFVRGEDLYLL